MGLGRGGACIYLAAVLALAVGAAILPAAGAEGGDTITDNSMSVNNTSIVHPDVINISLNFEVTAGHHYLDLKWNGSTIITDNGCAGAHWNILNTSCSTDGLNASLCFWNSSADRVQVNAPSAASGVIFNWTTASCALSQGNSYRFQCDQSSGSPATVTCDVNSSIVHVAAEAGNPPDPAFISPTPANGSTIGVNYQQINITADESLNVAILEFGGTNSSMTLHNTTSAGRNHTDISDGNYTYRVFVNDSAGSGNYTDIRQISVNAIPEWFSNNTNSSGTTKVGQPVWFAVNWTNGGTLSGSMLSIDMGTGSFVNDTAVGLSGSGDQQNTTKNITATRGSLVRWRFFGNNTANAFNQTDNYQFVVDNTPPAHSDPVLNTSHLDNSSAENLTVWPQGVSDADSDNRTAIIAWYVDGKELLLVNMPFDSNISSTGVPRIRDYTSTENNGTLHDGTWRNLSCMSGGCYELDGSNDAINISDHASLDNLLNFTLEFWFNSNETINSSFSPDSQLFDKKSGAGPGYQAYFVNSNGRIAFELGNSSTNVTLLTSRASWTNNTWYYVAFVHNVTHASVYVNGSLDNITASNLLNTGDSSENLTIGRRNEQAWLFNGTLDEFRLYNRSLTTQQASANYNNRVPRYNVTVAQETRVNEQWYANVTISDGTGDSDTKKSNNLTIDRTVLVVLNSPADAAVTTNLTIIFNCTVGDDTNLKNASLYANLGGVWNNINNTTVTVPLSTVTFTHSVKTGRFTWNCEAYNDKHQRNFSRSNFTFTVTAQSILGFTVELVINNTANTVFTPGVGERSASSLGSGTNYTTPPEWYLTSYASGSQKGVVHVDRLPQRLHVKNSSSTHSLLLATNISNSRVMVAFTRGTFRQIEAKLPGIHSGDFFTEIKPTFGYPLASLYPVKFVLNYTNIDINSTNVFQLGTHSLVIANNGTEAGRPLITIKRA